MVSNEIKKWVENQRKQYNDEQIRQSLVNQGYDSKTISKLLSKSSNTIYFIIGLAVLVVILAALGLFMLRSFNAPDTIEERDQIIEPDSLEDNSNQIINKELLPNDCGTFNDNLDEDPGEFITCIRTAIINCEPSVFYFIDDGIDEKSKIASTIIGKTEDGSCNLEMSREYPFVESKQCTIPFEHLGDVNAGWEQICFSVLPKIRKEQPSNDQTFEVPSQVESQLIQALRSSNDNILSTSKQITLNAGESENVPIAIYNRGTNKKTYVINTKCSSSQLSDITLDVEADSIESFNLKFNANELINPDKCEISAKSDDEVYTTDIFIKMQ